MSSFLVHVITMAGIYALMALGLNLQAGYAGLVNFGFVAFVGVGAYAAAIASSAGLSLFTGIAAAIVAAASLSVVMARLGRNLSSDYWGIATLALAEILRTVALNEDWLTGGAQGISGIRPLFPQLPSGTSDWASLLVVGACLAVSYFAIRRIARGRFGRAIKVMREEPSLAVCLGYDLISLKTRASVVASVPAAVAGALLVHYTSFVGPDSMLASETFLVWTIVMIGGIGNNTGVLLGALAVQVTYSAVPFVKDALGVGSDSAGAVRLAIIGFLLLGCLIWRPRGLVPERIGVTQ